MYRTTLSCFVILQVIMWLCIRNFFFGKTIAAYSTSMIKIVEIRNSAYKQFNPWYSYMGSAHRLSVMLYFAPLPLHFEGRIDFHSRLRLSEKCQTIMKIKCSTYRSLVKASVLVLDISTQFLLNST
jgi:hypothetical protein